MLVKEMEVLNWKLKLNSLIIFHIECVASKVVVFTRKLCFWLKLLEEQELVNRHSQVFRLVEGSEGKIIINGIGISLLDSVTYVEILTLFHR